jgi:large subunit ribosomal protein L15
MLNQLTPLVGKRKKRIGQGWGSGSGKYSSRGIKGQHAREKIKPLFEGGQNVLYKKLPMLRGKLRNKPKYHPFFPINLFSLEKNPQIKDGTVVDGSFFGNKKVKILGGGELTKKIIIKKIAASQKAIAKIKQVGGEYQN